MKTDKELYRIFAAVPDWLFQLTRLPSPGKCSLRSFTVKALQRDADGVVVPEDVIQALSVVEFQFQKGDTIYTRTVAEMLGVQEANGMRPVQGLIFFQNNSLDPHTEPWNHVVKSKRKQEIEAMLGLDELPALEETESGKDLIRIGEEGGEEKAILVADPGRTQ